ncbi:MAG: tetratricopeptide repeat protein [Anaerolineae bacterium]|jgi:tetratricopeptide (TPR) repeat protein|uniref:tetratricopeptide repeat protein n=1 Tax=Candidatus Amarolinea dominans TaxID=3140696 RepID=UPI001D41CA69|nr:tetratricopeptide repeat protein [Anaerolineae bacterium]MBK7204233.1 tetratricopeptide repeat protein [Anaerolineae bacterium]MBK9093057.1 tetratricopeptide repeat protein [Anaerolineae bacterium]MBK9229800.1 tetratricopeptide repeat protein [Anaerolineae bacterium]
METVVEKLARASAAMRVGEMQQARSLYEEAIGDAPDNVEAWLGLAGLVGSPDDKRACFELALRLDPANREAVAGIEFLRRRSQIPLKQGEVAPLPDATLGSLIEKTNQRLAAAEAQADRGAPAPIAEEERIFCTNHRTVETMLRCNKCDRPMCVRCVRLTDVGYRCKECITGQQTIYFNAQSLDYPIAFGVGFIVCAIASPLAGLLLGRLGFFGLWIAVLIGSAAGGILAEMIRRAIARRRGRYLWVVAIGGILLGVLVGNIAIFLFTGFFPLLSLVTLIFTGLALSTTYARLR